MGKPMKLLYEQPAKEWVEALPLGNGRIGAMLYSIPDKDIFMLNEDTLWSGYPRDTNVPGAAEYYPKAIELVMEKKFKQAQNLIEDHMLGGYTQSYMPLGGLQLDFPDIDEEKTMEYRRELNLSEAIITTQFMHNSIHYIRETFISQPEQCMIINLRADKPEAITFLASFNSQLNHTVSTKDNMIFLDGICPSHVEPSYIESDDSIIYSKEDNKKGIQFRTAAIVECQGGSISAEDEIISVKDANSVTIKVFIRSSFNGYDKQPFLQGKDYMGDLDRDYKNVANKSFDVLKSRHIEDYQSLYNRVELDLGKDENYNMPTDKRLELFQQTQDDKGLYSLIFQYGRYLLISSSREGNQPANLQGIWNKEMRPPWSSNFTININTQMNYWHAEVCNLSELHNPLFQFIKDLRVTGSKTAKVHYGAEGFVAHHNSDIWRLSNPVGNFGRGTAGYAFWPMSAGWLCQHLFQHYEYTLDREFLRESAYPAIKEAAKFFLDTLVEDENGYLTIAPATSPENAFLYKEEYNKVSKVATMSIAIVKEVFNNCIKCSHILGLDKEFANEVHSKISKLFPYQIGSKGQLLEWEEEFSEPEPYHRHISHLYPLYPGYEITALDTPKLAKACKDSLVLRGDDGTGWSLGWKINTWARLHDGNHALKLLKRQLRYVTESNTNYMGGGGTYMNLFDAHPPFQIDGNFGACAGIAELFLQSYDDKMLILPALPDEFINGQVKGLCAKKGIVTDIIFKDGKLDQVKLHKAKGEEKKIEVIYEGKSIQVDVKEGESYLINLSMF